ncbi:radical SAM/Cys-rich protein [Sporomusaceae bacterium BoRhaA]|uniref:arsenosugar biosynthesis radical SAM (seleno)protein ArsS n=1 Tax=Pelorhabdus rhamnosifermentans TaxID=2772457 RepID=UPI001C0608CB|nr:arsenosugar biosynthesis radical SAM (seleno)protein ArsS [Pelorhabdus rhamnosifermentans]MBU2702380.1 radical SAM/Cys-rich protein [Pelorhabdus rhamnosifermentans]
MNKFQEYVDKAKQSLIRDTIDCIQVNMGYLCNLQCLHCHVEAGPGRQETMSLAVVEDCLRFAQSAGEIDVDITGGSPEMNRHLTHFISSLRQIKSVKRIIVRSNLAILQDSAYSHLPEFFAANGVEIVASMPCYTESNVTAQRGKGVYSANIEVLKQLNSLGYGTGKPELKLSLVYNPGGDCLPGPQSELEVAYKENLGNDFGITFDTLFTITNMPIGRFRTDLVNKELLDDYMDLLISNFNAKNLEKVMCRKQINVDWKGRLFDCDFNQMLQVPASTSGTIDSVTARDLVGLTIKTGDHCFGCTAGAGSSCQGSFA